MVYLNEEQLKQVEYLFSQSAQGNHILFDNAHIKKVLSRPTEELDFFNFANVEKIQTLLSNFVAKTSLEDKRSFLANLDTETYELLLRTYFNIVENSIFEKTPDKH